MALIPFETSLDPVLLTSLRALPVWPVTWVFRFLPEPEWPGALRCIGECLDTCARGFAGPCGCDETRVLAVIDAMAWICWNDQRNAHLPQWIEVPDEELATEIAYYFASLGIEVKVAERDARRVDPRDMPMFEPWFPFHPDVGIAQIRSFAAAAAEFRAARLWQSLSPNEVVRITSPDVPDGLEASTVHGGGDTPCALEFLSTERDLARCRESRARQNRRVRAARWRLAFEGGGGLASRIAELFEQFAIPVYAFNAYPVLRKQGAHGSGRLPDRLRLDLVEALLRALTRPTAAEIELGRLSQRVHTIWGEREITLEIPSRLGRLRPGELFGAETADSRPSPA